MSDFTCKDIIDLAEYSSVPVINGLTVRVQARALFLASKRFASPLLADLFFRASRLGLQPSVPDHGGYFDC